MRSAELQAKAESQTPAYHSPLADVPFTTPSCCQPRAAYVHVPFCAHRCSYCDFAIAVHQDQRIDDYIDALGMELSFLGTPQSVETLFLGGGTPTHLSVDQLERLLTVVLHWLRPVEGYEFTIEANPGTLDQDKIAVLAEHGVNRVSLGAQSFHPDLLRELGRDHVPANVPRAVARLKKRIAQVSLDLIFGVPGQDLRQWGADLSHCLELEPDHISTYGLTFEKGTVLWKRRERGLIQPVSEEAELEMYALAIDTLEAAGFEHYEISNFARPGKRSRHNQVYWANQTYLGFGMGAARFVNGRRELNTRNLQEYIRKARSGEVPTSQTEVLSPRERACETMALQLRRAEGIDRQHFRQQTGYDLDELAGLALACYAKRGLLADDGRRVCLTRNGKYVADSVIEGLL